MIWDFKTWPERSKFTFATCLFFTRREHDAVEVYMDEIATAAFSKVEPNDLLHLAPDDLPDHCDLIGFLIMEAVVHEWLHHEENLDERPIRFACEQVKNALIQSGWPARDHDYSQA